METWRDDQGDGDLVTSNDQIAYERKQMTSTSGSRSRRAHLNP
jgi:hypothetical protein